MKQVNLPAKESGHFNLEDWSNLRSQYILLLPFDEQHVAMTAATERNLISGLLPPTDVHRPTKVSVGPQLYGPAGTINADIIHHCFSGFKRVHPNRSDS